MTLEYTNELLYLSTIRKVSKLLSMREIILNVKSDKFLEIPLTHSINITGNRICCQRACASLCLLHLVEEVEPIACNLLL